MAILKNKLIKDYTMIPNWIIKSSAISNNAFRLLVYLYHLPEDWNIRQENISKDLNVGRTTVNNWIKELKEVNALLVIRNGKSHEYHLQTDEVCVQDVGVQDIGVQDVGVQVLGLHNKTNTTKTNNNTNTNNTKVIDNYFDDQELNVLFNDFLENRKNVFGKKVNTELSINRIISKLNQYSNEQKKAMLNEAIEKGYRSVFFKEPKTHTTIADDYLKNL